MLLTSEIKLLHDITGRDDLLSVTSNSRATLVILKKTIIMIMSTTEGEFTYE